MHGYRIVHVSYRTILYHIIRYCIMCRIGLYSMKLYRFVSYIVRYSATDRKQYCIINFDNRGLLTFRICELCKLGLPIFYLEKVIILSVSHSVACIYMLYTFVYKCLEI